MKRTQLISFAAIIILFGGAQVALGSDEAKIKFGKAVYDMQCARCHGPNGNGNGTDAKRMVVAPRNLVNEEYKFKTTEYGTPPSDEDLMWVLNHGMAGAGMPSFANLTLESKEGLIAYIKSISDTWGEYEPEPIKAPNEKLKPNLVRGKEVFGTLQCALCHGNAGRANGTSAATLNVPPANLTQGWTYRAGGSPTQIYYRLNAGIAGSGMPSYTEAGFTTDDLWHLSNYVYSMQLETNWDTFLIADSNSGNVSLSLADQDWSQAKRTDIQMAGQTYRNGKKQKLNINAVSVQSKISENEIAFRLSWNDGTQSNQGPADSILLAFKPEDLGGNPRSNLYTLYHNNAANLELMKWSSKNPNEISQGFTSLANASRRNWKGANLLSAKAEYKDGLWVVVFKRPRLNDQSKTISSNGLPNYIGLAAWDGGNNEEFNKRTTSQWIAFADHDPRVHH